MHTVAKEATLSKMFLRPYLWGATFFLFFFPFRAEPISKRACYIKFTVLILT